ncbi:MAG: hypothetical protein AAFU03_02020 [Bacteroidota bacterium]
MQRNYFDPMKLKYISLLLLLIPYSTLFAQDESAIDSLESLLATIPPGDTMRVLHLIDLWGITQNNDPDRSAAYARQIVSESSQLEYDKGLSAGYQRLGVTLSMLGEADSSAFYYRRALAVDTRRGYIKMQGIELYNLALYHSEASRLDSARHYLDLAREKFELDGGPLQVGAVINAKAGILRDQGNFRLALESGLEARKYFIEAGDSLYLIDAELEIGHAYSDLERYQDAYDTYASGMAIAERYDDDHYTNVFRLNLAEAAWGLRDTLQSLALLRKTIEVCQAKNFKRVELVALNLQGLILTQTREFSGANGALQKALTISTDEKYPFQRAKTYIALANLSNATNRPQAAEQFAQKGMALAKKISATGEISEAYAALSKAAETQGNYQNALFTAKEQKRLQDSLNNMTTRRSVAELQTLYETEKRDRQIEEQATQLRLKEQEASIAKLQTRFLWSGLLGAVLLFGAIAYSLRQRIIRSRLEKVNLERQMKEQQKELSAHTLHLVQKNQLLEQLRSELQSVKGERPDDRGALQRVLHTINSEEQVENDWQSFKTYFQQVHGDFEDKLRATAKEKISSRELRLAALLKTGLSNAEISPLLQVSQNSLYKAKYRLRKKLPVVGNERLEEFVGRL